MVKMVGYREYGVNKGKKRVTKKRWIACEEDEEVKGDRRN
jgi:hypothetical protein